VNSNKTNIFFFNSSKKIVLQFRLLIKGLYKYILTNIRLYML